MDCILILYYSGVGNTKRVAKLIYDKVLAEQYFAKLYSIEEIPENCDLNAFQGLIVGCPTIHAEPAAPMLNFLSQVSMLNRPIPAFVFTTCGLYSANTLRIFALECKKKNIISMINRSYRCMATDGILLAPKMKVWFHDEKHLSDKVERDTAQFLANMKEPLKGILPHFKLYSIFNYPNKVLGHRLKFNIYLHRGVCIRCGTCINHCPAKAIHLDNMQFPSVNTDKCLNCYRCIHHCPKRALSLSKKKRPSQTLFSENMS